MSIDRIYRLHHVAIAVFLYFTATSVAFASESPPSSEDTSDPIVEEAKQALRDAEFDALQPLLEPLVTDGDRPISPMAHLLYALGLVYEAPTDAEDDYFEAVDHHIEQALEAEPDIELDPLIHPPNFIARVEEIRHHMDSTSSVVMTNPEPVVFYFEREVEIRSRLPLFLPGGAGQFHNDARFRGITFASVQAAGLGANVVGHWMIESMRNADGHIPSRDVSRARDWRRLQYAGLATFAAGWIIGVVEANMGFESQRVRIRTLDSPPQELEPLTGPQAVSPLSFQLQLSASF